MNRHILVYVEREGMCVRERECVCVDVCTYVCTYVGLSVVKDYTSRILRLLEKQRNKRRAKTG